MVILLQLRRADIQPHGKRVWLQFRTERSGKFRWATTPFCILRRDQRCYRRQNRVWRRVPSLRLLTLQIPCKRLLVTRQIQPLILLVSAGNVQRSSFRGAKFFLQNQCPICAAEQTVCSGDHIEPIFRLLLARMVYQKQTDSQLFGKRFQFADTLIIAGIMRYQETQTRWKQLQLLLL